MMDYVQALLTIDNLNNENTVLNKALRHIRKMGRNKHEYSTLTTCGYKLMLEKTCMEKRAIAYFIFNDVSAAVEIPTNVGCYHTFAGFMEEHQTAVPITFDGKFVIFDDPEMNVFAWGAGKSVKRIYLEERGVQFEEGERFHQRRLEDYFNEEAGEDERAEIIAMGWM